VTKTRAGKLGEHLLKTRLERGLSTRRLADQAGVSHSTIHRIEHGRFVTPRREVLTKVSIALGLNVADVYAHAGYLLPHELPHIDTYLAAKYGDLPSLARQELAALALSLAKKHSSGADARTTVEGIR
jgi:transcriptional regulator with XRE-family HTH domain